MSFEEWAKQNLGDCSDAMGQAILKKCKSAWESGYNKGKEDLLEHQDELKAWIRNEE